MQNAALWVLTASAVGLISSVVLAASLPLRIAGKATAIILWPSAAGWLAATFYLVLTKGGF